MQEFRANTNLERTNGGGAVAYIMKYAFKSPKAVSIEAEMQREEDAEGRDVQHQGQQTPEQRVRTDLRTYMRARRIGVMEAY